MSLERSTKRRKYAKLLGKTDAVLGDETDPITWMSTLACLIKAEFDFLWVGFYLEQKGELTVGPYQGSLGCLRISFSNGVCGACASSEKTISVNNVDEFEGYISCDGRSKSEIVVPVFDQQERLRAVLDIDSSELGSFDDLDKRFLEELADKMRSLNWNRIN